MQKQLFVAWFLLGIAFLASFIAAPTAPDQLVSHWDINNQPNGYFEGSLAVFIMPFFALILLLIFIFLPEIDPLKKNIASFYSQYAGLIAVTIGFIVYLHIIMLLWNIIYQFSIIKALIPVFACLFYYLGVVLKASKRNWFIGIRTPWTLSNDQVWKETHLMGSILFKWSAVITLLGLVVNELLAFFFIILPMLVSTFYVAVFSFFSFKKIKK